MSSRRKKGFNVKAWLSWEYTELHKQYKEYMKEDESAGVLLRSRLNYHEPRKCLISCNDPGKNYRLNNADDNADDSKDNKKDDSKDNKKVDSKDVENFFRKIGRLLKRFLKDESFDHYKGISATDPIVIKDVMLLSVIFNKREYVMRFLKEGLKKDTKSTEESFIYAALFASAIFKILSKLANAEENMDLSTSYRENSRYFEVLACNSVAHMYVKDRTLTHILLTQLQPVSEDQKKTVMQIAKDSELMQFMGTTACQTKLKSIWREHMSVLTSREMILICIFLPFLIPFITFVNKSEQQNAHKQALLRINWCGCTDISSNKVGLIQAMYWFYSAPVTKFWTNLISYFLMLCCFSFFVLTDVHPVANGQISLTESWIFLWILTLLLEELRQICQREHVLLWNRIKSWWTDNWNRFDAIIYVMFFLSVFLRFALQKDDFSWAQIMYSITLALFILRSLQFFYVAKNTGPKIIMLGKMATDLQFFIMIFFVILVSFGIIIQANLYPNADQTWQILRNVVYYPYWQIYGELFLETISGHEPSPCTTEPSIYRNGTLPRCPKTTVLVPLVLAVYMVLTNVMLLNLLIAMFSNTFQKIQDNSVLIWKFHRYSLVREYYERPVLPPPLIIFNHIYRTILFVKQKLNKDSNKPDNVFERTISGDEKTKELEE